MIQAINIKDARAFDRKRIYERETSKSSSMSFYITYNSNLISVTMKPEESCFTHCIPYDNVCFFASRCKQRACFVIAKGSCGSFMPIQSGLTGTFNSIPNSYTAIRISTSNLQREHQDRQT